MKNFKKIALVLSLTAAIGIGSLAYASDFSTNVETSERIESNGGHCYEREVRGRRHNNHRHHRGHRNHNMNRGRHNGVHHRR